MEIEKLANEKTEMQRHYVMVCGCTYTYPKACLFTFAQIIIHIYTFNSYQEKIIF